MSHGLRALAAATSDESPDALGRRLLEVFAERQSAAASTVAVGRSSGWSFWLSAAAALLMVVGSTALWLTTRRPPVAESSTRGHELRADGRTPQPAPAPAERLTGDGPRTPPSLPAAIGLVPPGSGRRRPRESFDPSGS